MEDTDNNLQDIYKSAITAMRKEVHRLNSCLDYQHLSQKLEKRQEKIQFLKNELKTLDQSHCSYNLRASPTPSKSNKHYSIRVDNTLILEDKIIKLQNKINKEKSNQWRQEELFERKLQKMDPSLYLTVSKFDRAKKINLNLKTQLHALAEQRKQLNFTYSRVTSALRKELTLNQKLESVEDLEKQIKDKQLSIRILSKMIEQFHASMSESNPEVKEILEKVSFLEETRKEHEKTKVEIQSEIKVICEEIEGRMKYPEKISIAAANMYCRQEIKRIQLDIVDKSKACKELEHERLMMQMKYSESLKLKGVVAPKSKRKTLSNVNTHSSFATDRASSRAGGSRAEGSRAGGSKTPGELSARQSSYVFSLLNREKECTITKDLMKALDFFAPGQKLTDKIIAFNRSDCALSQRSIR